MTTPTRIPRMALLMMAVGAIAFVGGLLFGGDDKVPLAIQGAVMFGLGYVVAGG